jgi:transcription initiation factor TFIID subunit 2
MPGVLLEMESQGAPVSKAPEHPFLTSHQVVELEVDFSTQTLTGRCEITLLPQTKDIRAIKIDARQCVIPQGKVMVN